MELVIKGKNTEISEAVRQYVERKMGKLDRHLRTITEAEVAIGREMTKSRGDRYVVQATLNSKGTLIRGEERGVDLYAAIDSVADVLNRQIERYKGRRYNKGRGISPLKAELPLDAETEKLGRVVKVKRFMVKPMDLDEAVEQMELLGHDFFFFFNSASGQFNVLYQRKDGDYGLIEPDMA
jgi:putative sigma-54 modulation protein